MKKVLYIPLDDRPANLDDVLVQGASAGIRVITPEPEDIMNRMDSRKTDADSVLTGTSDPTFGNTANIHAFIRKHAAEADGFIISSDMLAYGGLIGSRRLRTEGSGAYPDYDPSTTELLDVIREVKEKYPAKPVYVLDTIMRLATTTYVEGVFQNAYDESRAFMKQPRKEAAAFEEILDSYDLKPDGTAYGETVTFDKRHYYEAKRHKFKSNLYILDQLTRQGYIDFLAIGVDDSFTQGVQANEIAFIEKYITDHLGGTKGQNPDRAIILPDADGLGHSLMARMAQHFWHHRERAAYSVRYFGRDGSEIINPYEYMSVHDNIRHHIDMIGGKLVTDSPEVEIIAITDAGEMSGAVSRMEENRAALLPSVVIDFVAGGSANPAVTEALLDSPAAGQLLGYSAWNTAGNKIGIALGMAQARYAFLTAEKKSPRLDEAVEAHGTLLFKRFLKDYYYKALAIKEIRQHSRANALYTNIPYADGNMQLFNPPEVYEQLKEMLRELMQQHTKTLASRRAFGIGTPEPSSNVRQIRPSKWVYSKYEEADLDYDNPAFIWHRAFEITVNPEVSLT